MDCLLYERYWTGGQWRRYLLNQVVSDVFVSQAGGKGVIRRIESADEFSTSTPSPDTGCSLYAPALFGIKKRVRSLSARSFRIPHVDGIICDKGGMEEGIPMSNHTQLAVATIMRI